MISDAISASVIACIHREKPGVEAEQIQAGEPNLVIAGLLWTISPVSETVK